MRLDSLGAYEVLFFFSYLVMSLYYRGWEPTGQLKWLGVGKGWDPPPEGSRRREMAGAVADAYCFEASCQLPNRQSPSFLLPMRHTQ